MKLLLTSLNSRYTHQNLAIHYFYNILKEKYDVSLEEYTINDRIENIAYKIYRGGYDLVLFSIYIWNINMSLDLISYLKEISNVKIVAGGPEVSFDYEEIFKKSDIDFLIIGEGEEVIESLLDKIQSNSIINLHGVLYKKDGEVQGNSRYNIVQNTNNIPCIYLRKENINKNKYLYYEVSRGCPYNCKFCLSSTNKGVRVRDKDIVFKELKNILDSKVSIVKFVDRSFNFIPYHYDLIKFLIDNDNNITKFHLEIHPSLISDEFIGLFKKARSSQFQFEIGLQTTNLQTEKEINRVGSFDDIKEGVLKLKETGIHIHMDLIFGLPYETYEIFKKSFNDLYSLKIDKIQLGFLKLLKGSRLREDYKIYNYRFLQDPPYEVISNMWVSIDDVFKMKVIEDVVEKFYNEKNFEYTINQLEEFYNSPFDFFEDFASFWEDKYYLKNISKSGLYDAFLEFLIKKELDKRDVLDCLRIDYLRNNNRSQKSLISKYFNILEKNEVLKNCWKK